MIGLFFLIFYFNLRVSIVSARHTAQKMKFSIKDFFSKCGQIRSFLQICSHLLKKFLMENIIFCAVTIDSQFVSDEADKQTYLALDPSNFDALQTGRWQCVSKADSTMKKTISSKCRWKWGSDPKANSRQKYFDVGDSIRPSAIDKSPEAFNDKINC